MRRALVSLLLSLSGPGFLLVPVLVPPTPPAQAQEGGAVAGDDVLVEQVRKSIDSAIVYFEGQQRGGNWEVSPVPGDPVIVRGGTTALVLLAMLEAGVPPTNPSVQRGLEFLRGVAPSMTYVVGLQTMVFVKAGQKVDGERIQRNVKWLLDAQGNDGWGYGAGKGAGTGADNSNTQYALLGLHEAIQAGYKVPEKNLRDIQKYFLDTRVGGGWGYKRGTPKPSMTMTSAGVRNLVITGLDLNIGKARLREDGSAEDCGKYAESRPIREALVWIGDGLPAELNMGNALARLGQPFYCLYGLERAGRLTGQRYFGGHDWYEVGCRFLVSNQKASGAWESPGPLKRATFIPTSFGLLFLSKGRTPILISKLAYGRANYEGWNNKRNDLRHLVDYVGKQLFPGRPMAWQAFDVRAREVRAADRKKLAAELLQSPVVYFNGHDMTPRGEYRAILKEYVENGGFILAENCCGKDRFPRFDGEIRDFVKDVFPDNDLVELEADHPIYTASGKFAVSPKRFPLWGVKQGCKTVLVYSPGLAGHWEHNDVASDRGSEAFKLGANIVAYATGLEPPRPRLSKVVLAADDKEERRRRGFLKVGQLRHEGDWQPAPRAMFNLMSEAHKVGLDVYLAPAPVFPSAGTRVKDHRFLYMHGRKTFEEPAEGLKDLRFALKSGTVLLADACCGAKAFDDAFRRFVGDLFAADKLKLQPIPPSDELYSAELNGEAIRTVRRRVPSGAGKAEFQSLPPELEGIKYRNRWVVIYSKWDLGCALEKHSSPDCKGHDHDSALRLGRAAVLYALKR